MYLLGSKLPTKSLELFVAPVTPKVAAAAGGSDTIFGQGVDRKIRYRGPIVRKFGNVITRPNQIKLSDKGSLGVEKLSGCEEQEDRQEA
jgi:hypothetical protein